VKAPGKEFVPPDASIIRIAQAVRESEASLWDFGEEYAMLNALPEFNYRGLARAVKDQHGIDIYPPSTATKLRKAYERYVTGCGIPMARIRQYSPYYLYELSNMVEVTRANVEDWLRRVETTPRADLLEQVRAADPDAHEDMAIMRVPENVYQMVQEATAYLGMSIGQQISPTVFLEFVTELVLNTKGMQLRRLYDAMHDGPEEG
jgi:hypothetical protein